MYFTAPTVLPGAAWLGLQHGREVAQEPGQLRSDEGLAEALDERLALRGGLVPLRVPEVDASSRGGMGEPQP